ncbi:hypothetical protein COU95_00650, partial [Candidatus Shapirobacteria bacterium CG10_big_fil_rev_8_21_14_0_10_40_9]
PEALNLVPRSVAETNNLLPFSFDKKKNELSLAMADPLNLETVEFVEKKTGAKIKPFMTTPSEVKNAIVERYGAGLATDVTAALKEVAPEIGVKTVDIKKLGEIIREA